MGIVGHTGGNDTAGSVIEDDQRGSPLTAFLHNHTAACILAIGMQARILLR